MASGVKITNDVESIINAAIALLMMDTLYPTADIKLLQTMGDDLIIVCDIHHSMPIQLDVISEWYAQYN